MVSIGYSVVGSLSILTCAGPVCLSLITTGTGDEVKPEDGACGVSGTIITPEVGRTVAGMPGVTYTVGYAVAGEGVGVDIERGVGVATLLTEIVGVLTPAAPGAAVFGDGGVGVNVGHGDGIMAALSVLFGLKSRFALAKDSS